MPESTRLIGLFPAGGRATRLGHIPTSKEILSVADPDGRPVAVSRFLVDAYTAADVDEIIVINREDKTDIKKYYSGTQHQDQMRYVTMRRPWGTPFTLDDAWPLIQDSQILLGFPDIIIQPRNVFCQLKETLLECQSDMVLGLFQTDTPQTADMVRLSESGEVLHLDIKPISSDLTHTWITAIWQPSFTEFMHEFLQQQELLYREDSTLAEPFVGTVINVAIQKGFHIIGQKIDDGRFLDVGTPDALACAQSGWALA